MSFSPTTRYCWYGRARRVYVVEYRMCSPSKKTHSARYRRPNRRTRGMGQRYFHTFFFYHIVVVGDIWYFSLLLLAVENKGRRNFARWRASEKTMKISFSSLNSPRALLLSYDIESCPRRRLTFFVQTHFHSNKDWKVKILSLCCYLLVGKELSSWLTRWDELCWSLTRCVHHLAAQRFHTMSPRGLRKINFLLHQKIFKKLTRKDLRPSCHVPKK